MSRNAWKDSGGSYVSEFRKELDEVAKLLGAKTRFNLEQRCAELYVPACRWCKRAEEVLVQVNVTGECSVAGGAKVTSPQPLLDSTKKLLKKALSRVNVRFEVQP
jgi:hypothetical protein